MNADDLSSSQSRLKSLKKTWSARDGIQYPFQIRDDGPAGYIIACGEASIPFLKSQDEMAADYVERAMSRLRTNYRNSKGLAA